MWHMAINVNIKFICYIIVNYDVSSLVCCGVRSHEDKEYFTKLITNVVMFLQCVSAVRF
jgi:hypothetical protein